MVQICMSWDECVLVAAVVHVWLRRMSERMGPERAAALMSAERKLEQALDGA